PQDLIDYGYMLTADDLDFVCLSSNTMTMECPSVRLRPRLRLLMYLPPRGVPS
ncbi:hypothetical protein AVEN_212472-1, partial [Araneus ventricosus]